jgi:hypothetical protein
VRHNKRVVIYVDHSRRRIEELNDLMDIGWAWQPHAHVQELMNPQLAGQLSYCPDEKITVGPGIYDHLGVGRGDTVSRLAVSGEVVLATQPVIVPPGGMWN